MEKLAKQKNVKLPDSIELELPAEKKEGADEKLLLEEKKPAEAVSEKKRDLSLLLVLLCYGVLREMNSAAGSSFWALIIIRLSFDYHRFKLTGKRNLSYYKN